VLHCWFAQGLANDCQIEVVVFVSLLLTSEYEYLVMIVPHVHQVLLSGLFETQ